MLGLKVSQLWLIAKRTDVDLSGAGVGLEGTRRFTNYERLEGVVSDQSGYGFQTVASISPKGKSSSTVAELKKFVNKNKNNPFVYVVTLVATGDKPAFSPDEPSKENLRLLDQLVQDLRKRLFPVDSVILNNKNVLVYNSPSVREIARGPNRELYKDSIGGFDLDEKQDLESFLKDIFETPDQGELRGYPTIQKPLGSTHYVDIRVGKQHVFGYKFPPNMLDRVRTNTNKYIESLVRITDEPIYVVIARDLRPKEKEELRQVLTELKQGDKLTPLDVEAIIRDNILGGQVYFNQHSHGLPQDYKYFWADSRFFRIADSLVEQVGFKAAFKFTLNGLRKHILTGRMSAMETGLSVLADSSQKARLQSNRHELANIIGQIEAENRQILEKGSSPGSKGDRTQSSSTSLEKTAKDLEARIQGETRNLIGAIGQNGKLKPETINISLSMDGNRGSLLVTSNEEAISWISFVLWRHKGKTTLTIDQQNTMIAYQGTGLMKYLQSHIFEAFDVDMVKYTKVTKAGRKFAGNLANGTNNIFTHIENLKARDLVAHVNKAGLREFLNQQERSSSSSDSSSPSSQLTQEQAAEGRSVSSSTKGNQDLGGIDLSPANLDLEVRGGSIDLPQFKVPFDLQTFEGFTFRILKIEPIKSLNKEVSRR